MKVLKLNCSKTIAFNTCKTALSSCDIDITEECPNKNFIKGATDISFLSFGNHIEITLTESTGSTTVNIHSESAAKFQLIDWGKNDDLETKISETLMQTSK